MDRNNKYEVAMKRVLVLAYGLASYLLFLGVFLYGIGFTGGFLTPTSLDGAVGDPGWWPLIQSALVNLGLVAAFGIQHSVMARPAFKKWLTNWIPEPIERSTYVLATNLALGVLFWQWQPMGGTVWNVESPWGRLALWFLFAKGWLTVLVTTFLINHFDLFGLRQVWFYFIRKPYTPLSFATPGPYRMVRHPLYMGWLLAFWATPTMTVAHLLFALTLTIYILLAIRWEERDLLSFHRDYALYQEQVPMLIPRWPVQLNSIASEHSRTSLSSSRLGGNVHSVSDIHQESKKKTPVI